ncbi:histone chaperone asf1 [Blumeria hordei DH14]|uniref:Histone chaperone n=1 Tax=Blumeria graminis f. sp. hordei (strain DH14) TaxID=546991 RepID=N1J5J4_BLUG1|nr:histone chaperone asf1 [Blumeria hordei DH14]
MSVVSLLGVNVLQNPARFGDPYEFEITFECLETLQKGTYIVGHKLTPVFNKLIFNSNDHDQELDSLLVGPIPVGVNKFIFVADPPDTNKIPDAEILGVTVILLTCAYDGREFVRVGYYVNNEYDSDELNTDPPAKPILEKVRRNILAEKPRVTRFAIKWDSDDSAPPLYPPEQPEADLVADGEEYGAEEAEDEEEEESADGPEVPADPDVMIEDSEVAGAMVETVKATEEESDAGSEDLEAESSGSEEDEIEEDEEREDEPEEAMDLDGAGKPNGATSSTHNTDTTMAH